MRNFKPALNCQLCTSSSGSEMVLRSGEAERSEPERMKSLAATVARIRGPKLKSTPPPTISAVWSCGKGGLPFLGLPPA